MQRYEHSGIVPASGLLLFSTVAAAAAILGAVYTYLVVYIPFIYVNFIVTVGFAYVLGTASGWCARMGKIRNTFATGFLAFVVAIGAYYVSWAFDPLARFGPDEGGVLFQFGALLTYIQLFYEQGTWTLAGDTAVTGLFLGGIWLAEAVILFGGAVVLATQQISDHPFCERCHEWTTKDDDVRRFSLINVEPALLEHLKEGKLEVLSQLVPAAADENAFLRLDLAKCLTCSESTFVTLKVVSITAGNDGEKVTEGEALLENLIIDTDESQRLCMVGPDHAQEDVAQRWETDEGDEALTSDTVPVG